MNILLIDDEPNLLTLLKRPLIKHGYTITEAHNGEQGWKLFLDGSHRFDVIVTDVNMPVLDGIELLKRLREKDYDIPVIMMTGCDDTQTLIQILRLGAIDFLLKPFKAQELIESLDKLQMIQENRKKQIEDLPFFTENIEITIHSQTALIATVGSFLQDRIKLFCHLSKIDEHRIILCLHEALANAVIHGNLEIPSALKNESPEQFEQLLKDRETLPEFENRTVSIRCQITTEHLKFEIEDQGQGFDPQIIQDPDPMDVTGRGILIITAFMDEVFWNETGNRITMIKHL